MLTSDHYEQAFENTSTSVAASQMRNALNVLADSVTDEKEKARFETEMDNFFALFRRYLNDKAKGKDSASRRAEAAPADTGRYRHPNSLHTPLPVPPRCRKPCPLTAPPSL